MLGTTVLLCLAATSFADAGDSSATSVSPDGSRVSRTLQFEKNGRGDDRVPSGQSQDQYPALRTGEVRKGSSSKTQGIQSEGSVTLQSVNHDFWVYDADVILFYDQDNDGYFTGIDLNFDVDTIYNSAEVYAAVFLSYEGGPWNEYAVSDDFTIFDTSGGDDYTMVTDLVDGYPTGDYDLLIEIYDAYSGAYLASFGPEDSSELSYLPLEDFDRDTPTVVERRVTVTRQGGGAAGFWMLAGLSLILAARLRRRA